MSRWLTFFEYQAPTVLSRIENFVPFHTSLAEVLNDPGLVDIVSVLMGQQAILYKDRLNFKAPGAGPHEAHQDGAAFEAAAGSSFDPAGVAFVSALIAIDDATIGNGCLEVATDWHAGRLDMLPMEFPEADRPTYSKIHRRIEAELDWAPVETESGDVVLFTDRLPHRSSENRSSRQRRAVYGVYSPSAGGDRRAAYFEQKRRNINDAQYMIGNPHAASPPYEGG